MESVLIFFLGMLTMLSICITVFIIAIKDSIDNF